MGMSDAWRRGAHEGRVDAWTRLPSRLACERTGARVAVAPCLPILSFLFSFQRSFFGSVRDSPFKKRKISSVSI